MRKIIFITFLFLSNFLFSQQIFEICGESVTHTYFSTFSGPGTNTWYVNGISYSGDELTYTFNQPGTYNIVIRRENVICYTEESYQVIVTQCPGILYWIPNSFTPDGNEFNQSWLPIITGGFDPFEYTCIIYDRWGEIIWETHSHLIGWDGKNLNGKDVQQGTYTWKILLKVPYMDKRKEYSGHLNLIR